MSDSWDDPDWEASEQFNMVLREFYVLNNSIQAFDSHFKELNIVMKDFLFALTKLFERYPNLLEECPEGRKLMEASEKVANIDWSKFSKPT